MSTDLPCGAVCFVDSFNIKLKGSRLSLETDWKWEVVILQVPTFCEDELDIVLLTKDPGITLTILHIFDSLSN